MLKNWPPWWALIHREESWSSWVPPPGKHLHTNTYKNKTWHRMEWDGMRWGWLGWEIILNRFKCRFMVLRFSFKCAVRSSGTLPPAPQQILRTQPAELRHSSEVRPRLLRLSMLWLMRWLNSARLLRYRLTAWIMHAFLHLCRHKRWRTLGWRMWENINSGSIAFLLHLYCIIHDEICGLVLTSVQT